MGAVHRDAAAGNQGDQGEDEGQAALDAVFHGFFLLRMVVCSVLSTISVYQTRDVILFRHENGPSDGVPQFSRIRTTSPRPQA